MEYSAKMSTIVTEAYKFCLPFDFFSEKNLAAIFYVVKLAGTGKLEFLENRLANIPSHARLYYSLMDYLPGLKSFFPVHDATLFLGNFLLRRFPEPAAINLLDWNLLPAVVAIADCLPQGTMVRVPGQMPETGDLAKELAVSLPNLEWTAEQGPGIALGCAPRQTHRESEWLFERLESWRGGFLLAGWDYLGMGAHIPDRARLVHRHLLESVLQLPRPRRQGSSAFPAILGISRDPDRKTCRLARVSRWEAGPGALNQREALELVAGQAKAEASIDVPLNKFALDGKFTLMPSAWLGETASGATPQNPTLRSFAQVLRNQLKRERVCKRGNPDFGLIMNPADPRILANEIVLEDMDPLTGFIDPELAAKSLVDPGKTGKYKKYFLQDGDIVLAFRGSLQSLGEVGLALDIAPDLPSITGQSLCIIRPLPRIDPVWLYYYLQRPRIRRFLQATANGRQLMTVNLESIRDIPLELPSREEVERINEAHRKIMANMETIRKSWAQAGESLELIRQVWQED